MQTEAASFPPVSSSSSSVMWWGWLTADSASFSPCAVPQQGLLGELVFLQQQIQQHEEEVRRAAAGKEPRPGRAQTPPPGQAPSFPHKVMVHLPARPLQPFSSQSCKKTKKRTKAREFDHQLRKFPALWLARYFLLCTIIYSCWSKNL